MSDDLVEQLRLEKRELTWRAANRIKQLTAALAAEHEAFTATYIAFAEAVIKKNAALAALRVAREALAETRRVEVEHCEAMGFTESELPDFAFEHIDNALAQIDAVLGGGEG